MSYQVLARKWRPRLFREMVGQEHVLKALINALDHDRLHHAYLFTGTRGVGKTTVARIFAKCLNCDTGVSSEPCNQCSSCMEINEGRFVDLIEVDAASRTKVEDTRELLENVQYAPTRGRYKVYLIDEVHMLSNSSFNALLKTLEEPPPHIKFLLATTDPQKLPVTVLSRCLQFNLKNMSAERIVDHLQLILSQEMVPFEEAALWQLGRAANGSMRDALSLTDQAIAYSGGKITDTDVRAMLGTIDQSLVSKVLAGLLSEDAQQVLRVVAELAELSPDYVGVLGELITTLHRIAIAQVVPEAIDNNLGDRQQIYEFAQQVCAEDIQLYYQTALLGRRDLPLSPDPRSGFEMVLLRMLAFKPQGLTELPTKALQTSADSAVQSSQAPIQEIPVEAAPPPEKKSESPELSVGAPKIFEAVKSELDQTQAAKLTSENESENTKIQPDEINHALEPIATKLKVEPKSDETLAIPKASKGEESVQESSLKSGDNISLDQLSNDNWVTVYLAIEPGGLLQNTVANCAFNGREGQKLFFVLDEQQSTLYDVAHQQRMADLLSEYFHQSLEVFIDIAQPPSTTPAQVIVARQQRRQEQAEDAIYSDPVVKQLQQAFGAEIIEGSIHPIDK